MLDAGIALGVALMGLVGGLGAAARGGPAAAVTTSVLVAMGLILFLRRR